MKNISKPDNNDYYIYISYNLTQEAILKNKTFELGVKWYNPIVGVANKINEIDMNTVKSNIILGSTSNSKGIRSSINVKWYLFSQKPNKYSFPFLKPKYFFRPSVESLFISDS